MCIFITLLAAVHVLMCCQAPAKTLFAAITMVLMRSWCDVLTFPRHPSCHICPPRWGSCSPWPPPSASPWPWVFQTVSQEACCSALLCVVVTCNILVSSCLLTSLSQTRPHSALAGSGSPSRRVRETVLGWRPEPQCPAQSTGPAPDLERNLSLELSATGWHSHCPGPHPHHGGGVLCVWRYLYLKIWPLLCFVDDVKTESRVFMDHLASNLFEFWEFSIIMHMLKIETQVRCYRTTLHCAYELEVWNNCPLFVGRLWPSPRVTGESSLVHYLCSGLPPLLSRYQTSHITYQYSGSDTLTLSRLTVHVHCIVCSLDLTKEFSTHTQFSLTMSLTMLQAVVYNHQLINQQIKTL